MLKVQSYNALDSKISFQQNKEAQEGQKQPYFKTHAGAKLGVALSAIAATPVLVSNYAFSNLVELKGTSMAKDAKSAIRKFPIIAAIIIGCGVIVDALINKKRAKFAQDNVSKDLKQVLNEDKSAKSTEKGNVYHKSNVGKRQGALLGMVVLPACNALNAAKNKSLGKLSFVGVAINALQGLAGGFVLGAITDHFANKGARKFADRG